MIVLLKGRIAVVSKEIFSELTCGKRRLEDIITNYPRRLVSECRPNTLRSILLHHELQQKGIKLVVDP